MRARPIVVEATPRRPAPSPRDVLDGIRRARLSRRDDAADFAAVLLANEHEHRSFEALREAWRSAEGDER